MKPELNEQELSVLRTNPLFRELDRDRLERHRPVCTCIRVIPPEYKEIDAVIRLQAGDGVEGGGLAGAVGTQQSHDLSPFHVQINAADGLDGTIVYLQISYFKQCHGHTSLSFLRLPR